MTKTALITGASSGIGKELAKIHAQTGGNLVLVARREELLQKLKLELEVNHGVEVLVLAKDLSVSTAPTEIYSEVKNLGIEIDYLCNNAGFGGLGKFHERNWQDDQSMMQVNIVALTELSRLFLPDFVARNSGRILNVSSMASLMPGPLQAVYYATKAYVKSFSNAISEELTDTNVTVTNLMPGATQTGFEQRSGMDKTTLFDRASSAQSVAADGYKGMLAGKLDVRSGLTLWQNLQLSLLPLAPLKLVLRQVHDLQRPKN